jgi:hypothetical protein
MNAIRNQRYKPRIYKKAAVVIEDFGTGYHFGGTMLNYSADGMYVELDYAPRRRRKIRIKMNSRVEKTAPPGHLAEVRWRRPASGHDSSHAYGIGVRYC